jgi:hypothetical protein
VPSFGGAARCCASVVLYVQRLDIQGLHCGLQVADNGAEGDGVARVVVGNVGKALDGLGQFADGSLLDPNNLLVRER